MPKKIRNDVVCLHAIKARSIEGIVTVLSQDGVQIAITNGSISAFYTGTIPLVTATNIREGSSVVILDNGMMYEVIETYQQVWTEIGIPGAPPA